MVSRRFREAAVVVLIRGRSESVGTSGVGKLSIPFHPIPTGLRPPAQGCAARATLGTTDGMNLNPNGVASCSRRMGHNPVGVGALDDIGLRVARGAQPWALGRNPVGIQERRRPTGASDSRAGVLECGGMTPLSLHRCQVEALDGSGRFGAVHRAGKAETCLRSPKWRDAGSVTCDSAPPLFHPRRPCESARALAQSRTSRQRSKPRPITTCSPKAAF